MNEMLLNRKGINRTKVQIIEEGLFGDIPNDNGDKIRLAQAKFEELENSNDAVKKFYRKNRKKGYLISVWELNGIGYLVQCIKNEFRMYENSVFVSSNIEDLISIGKFLVNSIDEIVENNKAQIIDCKKAIDELKIKSIEEKLKENVKLVA